MAMASITVPAWLASASSAAGSQPVECSPTMARKPQANQGVWPPRRTDAAPSTSEAIQREDSSSRKGASSITRTIFSITATPATSVPMDRPAATTWATSCTVAPRYRPRPVPPWGRAAQCAAASPSHG
jgi:hypothetical protein